MRKLKLALLLHNHQPIGNFNDVFADAYRHSYEPLLEALERFPCVRLSLHYSGCLIDWIEANRPEFFPRLRQLVDRGQVEMVSGGYYEPILASIPDRDKRGQIKKLNAWIRASFARPARGLWLAERVWEPHLAKPIREAGLDWTVLDDTHFKMAGLTDDQLFGYYITEEQNHPLKVFATSKQLRYLIPWADVSRVIDYLASEASEDPHRVAVMGDDGEKFGVWPGTYKLCWEKGWMPRFFEALSDNVDWLSTETLSEHVRSSPALGRIYLPTASYAEMMEWALPPKQAYSLGQIVHQLEGANNQEMLQFVRGGFWRNFLVKYPEVNWMHKKMVRASDFVWRHLEEIGEDPRQSEALDEVWKGQCNCPYWHGVFGGSYMADIRVEVFKHLVAAETLVQRKIRPVTWHRWEGLDVDLDGHTEILVSTDSLELNICPFGGGQIREIDWKRTPFNLTATMARRPEAYHATLRQYAEAERERGYETVSGDAQNIHEAVTAKEKDLDQRLWYDSYMRSVLVDHFFSPSVTLEAFQKASFEELGDFVTGEYTAHVEESTDVIQVHLSREGIVRGHETVAPVSVHKRIAVRAGEDRFRVQYEIQNTGESVLTCVFGIESCFNLLGGGGNPSANYTVIQDAGPKERFALDGIREIADVAQLSLENSWLNIRVSIEAKRDGTVWFLPIETIANSEAGFERMYQGSCVVHLCRLSISPGQTWSTELTFDVDSVEARNPAC